MLMLTLEEQFKRLGFGSEETTETVINTQELLESITAQGTKITDEKAKASKFVFSSPMNYDRAKTLIETLMLANSTPELSPGEYKTKILNDCNISSVYKENPVEMIIYGSKGITDENHKLVLIDVLRTLNAKDVPLIPSYAHILTNWTWDDCLELTIKSIMDLRLKELAPMLYHLFETKNSLRVIAAKALIDIDAQDYFNSMINFLAVKTNEQIEEKTQFSDIMRYLGKNHPLGSEYIFNLYSTQNYKTASLNLMIVGLRMNLTNEILTRIEKIATESNQVKYNFNKMMRILVRCKRNNMAQHTIAHIKDKVGENNPSFHVDDCDKLISIAIDPQIHTKDRMDAVLYLAQHTDSRIDSLLDRFKVESDLMCIVAASASVERGKDSDLKLLFNYILKDENECPAEYIQEAIYQIRRLRGIIGPNAKNIQSTLEKLIKTLLQPGKLKSLTIELRLIELYSTGIPSENLGEIFLEKLQTTTVPEVQKMLLKFFEQHRGRFSSSLQERSLSEIIRLTKVAEVDSYAMKVLEALTRNKNRELILN